MPPTASVIVPAYQEPERISNCLFSLSGQEAEVIVVAADEETRTVARDHPGCDRVLTDDHDGPGAARNQGVDAATGELVLFTDADTVVPSDWVSRHRRHYETPNVVGVGGPARPLDGGPKDEIMFKILSDYWYRISWPFGMIQLPTFNCSYRKSTFREHGGFDEEVSFMEDTELSLRLRDAGQFVYDVSTRVATSARREAKEGYASLFFKYVRGYVQYYLLNLNADEEYFTSQ